MIPPHLLRRGDLPKVRPGYWFLPKAYGFGAYPATAMGWAATAGYLLVLGLAIAAMPTDGARIVVGTAITLGWLALVVTKTDGGWRWRWGERTK